MVTMKTMATVYSSENKCATYYGIIKTTTGTTRTTYSSPSTTPMTTLTHCTCTSTDVWRTCTEIARASLFHTWWWHHVSSSERIQNHLHPILVCPCLPLPPRAVPWVPLHEGHGKLALLRCRREWGHLELLHFSHIFSKAPALEYCNKQAFDHSTSTDRVMSRLDHLNQRDIGSIRVAKVCTHRGGVEAEGYKILAPTIDHHRVEWQRVATRKKSVVWHFSLMMGSDLIGSGMCRLKNCELFLLWFSVMMMPLFRQFFHTIFPSATGTFWFVTMWFFCFVSTLIRHCSSHPIGPPPIACRSHLHDCCWVSLFFFWHLQC